jgi:hypothetical protein
MLRHGRSSRGDRVKQARGGRLGRSAGRLIALWAIALLAGACSGGTAAGTTPLGSSPATVNASPPASPSTSISSLPGQHGIFTPTGATEEYLFQHAAAMLRDGRVLLVGGDTDGPSEIYDPSPGEFKATAPLSRKRILPSAVTLPDGRVLVVGAALDLSRDTGAEVYNPVSGTLSAVRPLVNRAGPAVALLRDGRVLIAGGSDASPRLSGCLASAELFDPASGKFTPTGSMKGARAGALATVLSDGRVLITGGGSCGDFESGTRTTYASAEIYDPASGRFASAAEMTAAREEHTATLLDDGRVLVAGGFNYGSGSYEASADIFDPETNSFTAAAPMSVARADHVAALLPNGKVLVAGGANDENPLNGMASAQVFDPATGTFIATGSMHSPRVAFTATLLADGEVLIAGGSAFERYCELYRP